MKIKAIAACAQNKVIGSGGELAWHYPEDMKYFSSQTRGQTVLMGRKTFDSLPEAYKPLPGRQNLVVTRQEQDISEVLVVRDLLDFLTQVAAGGQLPERYAKSLQGDTLWVIGGGEIYKQAMPYLHELHLTQIHREVSGDTYFPEIPADWQARDVVQFDNPELSLKIYQPQ